MIPVSLPFLPQNEEYNQMIAKLWDTKWLTNHGTLVQQLESQLIEHLQVSSLHFVSNGTMAIQLAIKSLEIKNEVITTPFSFVATTNSILWEKCKPVFVDINRKTLCIDVEKIEEAITDQTEAIIATHVFGIPCDVEKIEDIARKYNLKVIYDAAHAFGVKYKGKSVLNYGDISTLSFHATKLFHTVEGGAIINNAGDKLDYKIHLLRSFGFQGNQYQLPGINAKNSEFHAAMGLCNLKYSNEIIRKRQVLTDLYDVFLAKKFQRPLISEEIDYNYAYYPIIFDTENELLQTQNLLRKNNIESRRYFYPSLNTLTYLTNNYPCPISEDISRRVLCLPLYSDLTTKQIENISELIMEKKAIAIK